MDNKNVYGVTALLMGPPAADGGMSTALVEVFGQTVTGTMNITTTDPTVTDIPIEETDDPIMSITAQGTMNLAFSTYNVSPEALVKAFGGTLTGVAPNQVWNAPATAPEIIQSIRINTKNGRYVAMPKVKLNPRLGIVFDKTTPGKIDFTGTILVPDKAAEPKLMIGPIV